MMGTEVSAMLERIFFALGVVNNLCLLVIFVLRKRRFDLVHRFGWLYLLLAFPTAFALVLALQQAGAGQYAVFLGIFLAFLILEGLYDWVLKVPFRETMAWRWLVPYVALYLASSYGFIVMVWKYDSVAAGILMLVLTVAQLLANALTHPRSDRSA